MNSLPKLLNSTQQQQLNALLIDGPDLVCLTDLEGFITFMNSAGRLQLGYEPERHPKLHYRDFTVDVYGHLEKEIRRQLVEGKQWTGRVNYRHLDTGELIPTRMTTMLIDAASPGATAGVATIARDLRPELRAREIQEKLLTLVNNSKDMMTLLTPQGTNDYINAAGRRILGLGLDEDVTKIPISNFHTPEQLSFVQREILPSVEQTGRWSGRFFVRNRETGEDVPLENNCIRIDDPISGKLVAVGAVMRDLRPEISAQLELQRSEERFRQMIMEAPAAIGLLDSKDLLIVTANAMMLHIWGKDSSIIGKKLIDALPEIKDQGFPELLAEVARTGQPHFGYDTLALLYRNGRLEEGYFNFVYSTIRGPEGKQYIFVMASETTRQVLAKKQLVESEKRFRMLILEAPMATALYTGPDMVIDVANEAMLRLWGRDGGVIGMSLSEALPELAGQPFIPRLQELYRTGDMYHSDQEKALFFIDGRMQTFWFNYTYKPLRDEKGQVYAILNMAVDVSRLVELQNQKDEFIGIASHELKTPVTTIKGYTQMLENILVGRGLQNEAVMLKRVGGQVNKLNNLISDLFDVTKIQAGKMVMNLTSLDPDKLIAEIVGDTQHTISSHTILYEYGSLPSIEADPDRISQVLTNLLSNAIKYSPKENRVEVSAKAKNGELIVSVRDYGIGIQEENREKIFEQFYRADGEARHLFPGLGLGLYIAAEIIERHGGRIWYEPAPGKGSVFSFALPA